MNVETTAKRLKKLRENASLSHAKLRIALKEKYDIDISEASLKNYEVFDKYHSNYGNVKGMKIEYLDMFADFYNVSSDYILGRTKSKSINLTEQAMYDKYGLSVSALENLSELWENGKKSTMHNFFNSNSKEIIELNPAYIFDYMLSSQYFVESYALDLLRYCETRYNKRNDIDENSQPDRSSIFAIGTCRYVVLNHIEWFIENYYNSLVEKLKIKMNREENNNGNENE